MCVTQLCKHDELLGAEIMDFCTKKTPVFVDAIVRISKIVLQSGNEAFISSQSFLFYESFI